MFNSCVKNVAVVSHVAAVEEVLVVLGCSGACHDLAGYSSFLALT